MSAAALPNAEAAPPAGDVRRPPAPRGRQVVTGLASACALLMLGTYLVSGGDLSAMWRMVGVPPMFPPFIDWRPMTHGVECLAQGYDVLRENPCDPLGRPINYPPVWLQLRHLGVGQATTVPLGLATDALFLLAFWLYLGGHLPARDGFVIGLCLVSPTVLMALERGNVDLLLFALTAASAALYAKPAWRHAAFVGLVLLGTVLKLYPAALAFALPRRDRRAVVSALVIAAFALLYVLWLGDTLVQLARNTPVDFDPAYGRGVLALGVDQGRVRGLPLWLAQGLILPALVLVALLALGLYRRRPSVLAKTRHGTGYAFGAALFAGSFLMGVNWDYRLVVLLLTLPQLALWLRRGPDRMARVTGGVGLALILTTLWTSPEYFAAHWTDEAANWALFVLFGAQLAALGLHAAVAALPARFRPTANTKATPEMLKPR